MLIRNFLIVGACSIFANTDVTGHDGLHSDAPCDWEENNRYVAEIARCIASRTTSSVENCLEEISEEVIVLSDANDECRLCYAERLVALDRALPLTFSAVVSTVKQLLYDCVQPPTQPSCNATTIAAIGVDVATCVAISKLPFDVNGFSMAQCLLGEPDTAEDQCAGCLLTESFEFFMNETEKNSTNSGLFAGFAIGGVRNAKTTFFLDDAVTYCMADAPTTDAPTDAPATTSGASCLLVSSLVACIFAVAAAIA